MTRSRSRIAISTLFFLHGFCFSTWASRIPAIQEKLGLSEAALGSLLFAVPVGSLVSMPLAAWCVAKFGSRRTLSVAILLYASFLVLLGTARSQGQLLVGLVPFGLASNLVNIALNTQAVRSEAVYARPIMASFHGLWSLAGFFGSLVGAGMIALTISPFGHFATAGLVIFVGAFFGTRNLLADAPESSSESAVKSSEEKTSAFVWPNRSLLGLGFLCFCVMVCEGTMFDWSGIYFRKVLHAEGAWVSAGYVAFMTTMAGTRFIADRFKARFGFYRVLYASGCTVFTGLMISVLFPSVLVSAIGFLFVGAGVSAVVPLVLSEAGHSSRENPSAAIAAVSTVGFLGFVVGPPLIGWIAEATSLRVSFAGVAVLGLVIVALTNRRQRLSG